MRLVGPSVAIVRLIPSLLSFLTAVLLALLVRGLFESQCLALATLATLGILPWLFVIGRIGFEVAALPPFLAGFLLVWWKAQNRAAGNASDMDKGLGRWSVAGLSVLAGLLLGLSVYTYATGRLYVGLLVVGLWIGYVDNHGTSSERIVDPLGLEGGRLTALDHRSEEVRTFAVHRITAVTPVG